jgi:hypothetical protein
MILDIIKIGASLIDKLIPDKKAADEAKLKLLDLQQSGELKLAEFEHQETIGQIELNKVEAQNSNLFVSGWRPAAGWACVAGLVYSFFISPILGACGIFSPELDNNILMTMLFALLGLGGYRTFEKTNFNKRKHENN